MHHASSSSVSPIRISSAVTKTVQRGIALNNDHIVMTEICKIMNIIEIQSTIIDRDCGIVAVLNARNIHSIAISEKNSMKQIWRSQTNMPMSLNNEINAL